MIICQHLTTMRALFYTCTATLRRGVQLLIQVIRIGINPSFTDTLIPA